MEKRISERRDYGNIFINFIQMNYVIVKLNCLRQAEALEYLKRPEMCILGKIAL